MCNARMLAGQPQPRHLVIRPLVLGAAYTLGAAARDILVFTPLTQCHAVPECQGCACEYARACSTL